MIDAIARSAYLEPASRSVSAVPVALTALREVLFASDLSEECALAFSHARLLAERFSSHLSLYHALQAPPGRTADDLWQRQERAARTRLGAGAAGLRVTWETRVERAPSAAPALLAHLARARPDVVVMTTRRRSALAHLVLGSVTATVLEHGACPLLCVREPDHGVALPYRRVLLPTDLTAAASRALPLATLLARAFDAELIVLHVAPPARASADTMAAKERELHRFVSADCAGSRVTPKVERGQAGDGILRAARVHRPDVIVMSTRRRDSLMDRIVGTHAERVLRDSPCPVLVV